MDFSFVERKDLPTIDPKIRIFEVLRDGEVQGVIWMDLYQRDGKAPASYAGQYRAAESFRGKVIPLVALHSATPSSA